MADRRHDLAALEDRVLLVAGYRATNLTLRQIAPLFGVSKSAADRIVDHITRCLLSSSADAIAATRC